ncbi:MAG: Ig-like domain-containing protein [Magnetospirillum sp.]|nr:Ig-like domain-containing protein [Magnetospirillum sp.]
MPATSPTPTTWQPGTPHVTHIPDSTGYQGSTTLGDLLENALEHNPVAAVPHSNLIGTAENQVLSFAAGADFVPFDTILADITQLNQILMTDYVFGPPSFSIAKATTLTVPPPGLQSSTPSDVPQLVSTVSHGSLTLGTPNNAFLAPGAFAYAPDAGFVGIDSFTIQHTTGGQPVGFPETLFIDVTPPVHTAPVANNDLFRKVFSPSGSPSFTVDAAHGVLANDTDPFGKPLSVHLVTGPSGGTLSLAANGGLAYTPKVSGPPVDHFTYYDSNGTVNSPTQTAWIAITGQPTNFGPTQGVLAGDTGGHGALAAFVQTLPGHGTISLAPNGAFEDIPTAGFVGQDHFSHIAADGHDPAAVAAVTLNVKPASDFVH